MSTRQRLLVAVTPMGFAPARRALHRRYDLVSAFSMSQALTALKEGGIDGIVCSIHFDESRMFDLMRTAHSRYPEVRFIACRLLHTPLSRQALDAMCTTATALGCLGFVDFNHLQRTLGVAEADRRFCEAVAEHLEPAGLQRSNVSR